MVSNSEKWIRIFDIPEISRHKKGFTIYKVISMLYPENCPDAITKITVWKRYNDFKKIHRELKVLHRKFNFKDKFPSLPNSTFFKRFNEETVQLRRQNILAFLEFVGAHSQLFTSNEFVQFFESSHTPIDQLNGNINSIRADLNLPVESEFYSTNSDDEHTISDTDSITTLNSLSLSIQTADILPDPGHNIQTESTMAKLKLNHSRNSDSISTIDSILDGQIYPTPPNTPASTMTDSYIQYIIDASIHVNIAIELENDKKYDEAFTAYKTAIDILLKYGTDDKNYDRKQMVRRKTEKYLLRAEKIYNMYLSPDVKNLKKITEPEVEVIVQRPMSDLYKYKVVKIIESGMLVLHFESQQLFYIKVIHKTMKFLNENLILPENVPYMVKLHNYYNNENALFLILEYCSGLKLWDYIKRNIENPNNISYYVNNEMLNQVEDMELSDAESECSYTDLINDYTNNKNQKLNENLNSSGSYEKIDVDELFQNSNNNNNKKKPIKNLMDEPINVVDKFLINPNKIDEMELINKKKNPTNSSQRQLSDNISSFDNSSDDCIQNCVIPINDIKKWAAQLLLALEKLHTLGVICRDLQSHNLLINENADLNLTYMCNNNDLFDVFNKQKFQNLAPEIYSFQPITEAVDWWCFGAILYELLVGMPLSVIYPDGLTSFTNLKVPKYVSPEGRSLLKQLLVYEPNERLGCGVNGTEKLKSHPFFSSISWNALLCKNY